MNNNGRIIQLGDAKKHRHWEPELPKKPELTIMMFTTGKQYTFERTPHFEGTDVVAYHGHGFAIRFMLQDTTRGKRMLVLAHHVRDMPNVMTMIGIAAVVAPSYVQFAIMVPSIENMRKIVEETEGFMLAMHQVIPEKGK